MSANNSSHTTWRVNPTNTASSGGWFFTRDADTGDTHRHGFRHPHQAGPCHDRQHGHALVGQSFRAGKHPHDQGEHDPRGEEAGQHAIRIPAACSDVIGEIADFSVATASFHYSRHIGSPRVVLTALPDIVMLFYGRTAITDRYARVIPDPYV
jgi:hypothetical protein